MICQNFRKCFSQTSERLLLNLTLSWRRSLSYRTQSIDLFWKSMDWLLYDRDLRHERVKTLLRTVFRVEQINLFNHLTKNIRCKFSKQKLYCSLNFDSSLTLWVNSSEFFNLVSKSSVQNCKASHKCKIVFYVCALNSGYDLILHNFRNNCSLIFSKRGILNPNQAWLFESGFFCCGGSILTPSPSLCFKKK